MDSLEFVKEWLEARYIKEYFVDKEQKYVFAKHDLIKFIEKIIDLTIENTKEETKNHYAMEIKLMDLLKKIEQYNKDGIKYKIDFNMLELEEIKNDIQSDQKN